MPYNSPEAKRQMLNEIRAFYRGKFQPVADIDRFRRTYCSADAITWYTKSGFLFHIVNKALRTEDIRALYIFRYFVVDLCACLKEMAVVTRARFNTPFRVYRGSILSQEEVQQLHVDTLVATNGFCSSSMDLRVAQTFVGIDLTTGIAPARGSEDKRQHVLFEIDIDFDRSPELVVADVSELSAYPDENEIIFDLGTSFNIIGKTYDEKNHVWYIRMISSSAGTQVSQEYETYVNQRLSSTNGVMLYGNLIADILCDYREAVTYFQRLLRVLPIEDENRPNIYYHLGRIYRLMGKYKQSIEYFRAALLLQRRRLPQSKYDYSCTLSGLGLVFSEMGDSLQAVSLHTRALAIHRTLFSENHSEITEVFGRLTYALWQNRQYQRAFDLVSRALRLTKENISLTYPPTKLFYTLGLIYKAFGNRTQALEYLKQASCVNEKWFPESHPYTARTYYELASLYAEQSDQHAIALEYAQRALNSHKARVPPNETKLKQSIELVERLSQLDDTTRFNPLSTIAQPMDEIA